MMENEKIYAMPFSKVYSMLVTKAQRKGRDRGEVDEVACWLTGYTPEEFAALMESTITYDDFLHNVPAPNPNCSLIKGKICGIRVEKIENPLMREIRYLDKLVDELAQGRAMEKILHG